MNKGFLKGQIGIGQLIAVSGTIIVALIGGWFTQSNSLSTKIEVAKAEQTEINLSLSQRTSVVETNTSNLIGKVDKIDGKVDELLRRTK